MPKVLGSPVRIWYAYISNQCANVEWRWLCVTLPAMRETVRDSGWDELSDTSLMCKV